MSSYYLTDYNVPANNPSTRVAFYRARKEAIKQAIKDRAAQVLYSSQPVVISDDRQLVDRISDLAKIFRRQGKPRLRNQRNGIGVRI